MLLTLSLGRTEGSSPVRPMAVMCSSFCLQIISPPVYSEENWFPERDAPSLALQQAVTQQEPASVLTLRAVVCTLTLGRCRK